MNVRALEIAERIRGEVEDLDRIVERSQRVWLRAAQASPDQDMYIDSVALNLHSFYSGIERLLELIARHIDRTVPTSETWHRDLLEQMAQNYIEIRPAVISQSSVLGLDEFRRFRHLVRNVYATNLVPEKIARLISKLDSLWTQTRVELLAFAEFLEELGRYDSASQAEL
jgi:hypothetical protein